jgi:hypothetical protein
MDKKSKGFKLSKNAYLHNNFVTSSIFGLLILLTPIYFWIPFLVSIIIGNVCKKKNHRNYQHYLVIVIIFGFLIIGGIIQFIMKFYLNASEGAFFPWKEFILGLSFTFFIYLFFLIPLIFLIRQYGWEKLNTFFFDESYVEKYHLRILELAGQSVSDVADGFTERPYPLGRYNCSKEELISFANTLDKLYIAYSFAQKNRIVLVFNSGFFEVFPYIKPNFAKTTNIEFDFEGNMSIHITKKDYEMYKEELTFDRLCQSLGNLILRFLELFKMGKEDEILKIIQNVNVMKIPSFRIV